MREWLFGSSIVWGIVRVALRVRESWSCAASENKPVRLTVADYTVGLAWIIHEDSASRGNLAKQVCQSSEKRGLPHAEEDGRRCDARFSSGVE